jgi:predicted TIM-barrel enzyme
MASHATFIENRQKKYAEIHMYALPVSGSAGASAMARIPPEQPVAEVTGAFRAQDQPRMTTFSGS